MITLNELKEVLYSTFYIDVQNNYKEHNVQTLLFDYIDNKYSTRFARIYNLSISEYMLQEWLTSESNKLRYMNVQQKMAMIYTDENLIRIINHSAEIFKTALSKVSGAISATQQSRAQDLLQDLQSTIPLVAEFNQYIAQKELSEAIVEVNYILGISKNYSIRMHDRLQYGDKQ